MRFAALLFLGAAICQAQDPRALVARAVAADDHSDRLARDYTYKVRNETSQFDSSGRVKAVQSSVDEILYIVGKRFLRPLEKDGKPLAPDAQRKEQAKIDRAAGEAGRMTEAERSRRVQEAEQDRAKRRGSFKDVPDAFNFKLMGEELVDGRAAYRIEATPRSAYTGKLSNILHNVEGTLWIDKQDLIWVKFEGEVLNPFYLGWFLARVNDGTHISYNMMRVNDDLWVPKQVSIKALARFALFRKINLEQKVTFSEYRKFQTDSRIVSIGENP